MIAPHNVRDYGRSTHDRIGRNNHVTSAAGDDLKLPAPFRGARTYLHSTTLFDLLRKATGASRNLELRISRIIAEPVKAVAPDKAGAGPAAVGRFAYDADGQRRTLALVPDADAEAPGRVVCNEKDIMASTIVADGVARFAFRAGAPGSLIEAVVALNKKLIETLHKPSGKLYFTQAALNRLPEEGALSLRVTSHLGTRLFVSAIAVDGEELGTITFKAVN